MLDDRKKQVLQAIVEEYINTAEPVSSNALTNNEELLTLWTKKESYIKLNGGMLRDAIGLDINNINVIYDTFKLDNYIITICKSK